MLGESKAKELVNDVLKRLRGDDAEIFITINDDKLTRFANNAIHQNVAETNMSLNVMLLKGKRVGSATTNRISFLSW